MATNGEPTETDSIPKPIEVTSEEFNALNEYTNFGYVIANAFLRGQCKDLSPDEKILAIDMIKHIDDVFLKVSAINAEIQLPKERKYVYRGISSKSINSKFIGLQKSYTSTSRNDYVAWSHYGYNGTVMKIDITDVDWISLEPYSSYNSMNDYSINENEILLDRNITFEILINLDKNDVLNPYRVADARYIECKAVKVADKVKVTDKCSSTIKTAGGKQKKTKSNKPSKAKYNQNTRKNKLY